MNKFLNLHRYVNFVNFSKIFSILIFVVDNEVSGTIFPEIGDLTGIIKAFDQNLLTDILKKLKRHKKWLSEGMLKFH